MQNQINDNDCKIPDEILIEAIKGKDNNAFQKIMRRYVNIIFNFVKQYTDNKEDAEDITQDSFLKVWKNVKRFRKGMTFKPWLFAVARNTALDQVKKRRILSFSDLDNYVDEIPFSDSIEDTEPLPDQVFEHMETVQVISRIQKDLHPDYRNILYMHYYENMTFNEIAVAMGRSINTVKSWHRRALSQLKKILLHQYEA